MARDLNSGRASTLYEAEAVLASTLGNWGGVAKLRYQCGLFKIMVYTQTILEITYIGLWETVMYTFSQVPDI